MSEENKNVYDAKLSLKAQIKFFEALLKHVNGNDDVQKASAVCAAWCLHRYIVDGLIVDIENVMAKHGIKP